MTVEQARHRNWQKARLSGFCMSIVNMTDEEVALYQEMLQLKSQLLDHWDTNTQKMTGKPMRYKCWCGKWTTIKRLNPEPLFSTDRYLCKEHANEVQ